ncbi:hypothetical protein EVAR_80902_1 [Eumeta japonica]|uniref:Uncharacterized protein n=1 Tax=Eumeta variegata TaxID=151549 RepID=A0A4C1V088_EUMVA|nr:hypothetical protein EVAR_80902_1 [Eumeta japonica]
MRLATDIGVHHISYGGRRLVNEGQVHRFQIATLFRVDKLFGVGKRARRRVGRPQIADRDAAICGRQSSAAGRRRRGFYHITKRPRKKLSGSTVVEAAESIKYCTRLRLLYGHRQMGPHYGAAALRQPTPGQRDFVDELLRQLLDLVLQECCLLKSRDLRFVSKISQLAMEHLLRTCTIHEM